MTRRRLRVRWVGYFHNKNHSLITVTRKLKIDVHCILIFKGLRQQDFVGYNNNNNNLLFIRRKYLYEYIQMRLTSYIKIIIK